MARLPKSVGIKQAHYSTTLSSHSRGTVRRMKMNTLELAKKQVNDGLDGTNESNNDSDDCGSIVEYSTRATTLPDCEDTDVSDVEPKFALGRNQSSTSNKAPRRSDMKSPNTVYRPRGMIKTDDDGFVFWREQTKDTWKPAVYHNDIRAQLLTARAIEGQYHYPREVGRAPTDITAFHKDQEYWGFERHQRPDILHQYEKRDHKNPSYDVKIWIHNGCVVLDYDNHPILNFRNIPDTLSSKLEGGLQEAIMREDARIDVKDFRVRMPIDPKNKGQMSLPTNSAISMRRSRFRWKAGYISWTKRTGWVDIKNYLDNLLPKECHLANDTRNFRELKRSEVKKMALMNRGRFLERAGNRSITVAEREKMDQYFQRSIDIAEEYEQLVESMVEEETGDSEMDEDEDIGVMQVDDDEDMSDSQLVEDYRFKTPQTRHEQAIVGRATIPARRNYLHITGHIPPATISTDNYAMQWNYLQASLMRWWEKQNPDDDAEDAPAAPVLARAYEWYGGFPDSFDDDYD